MNRKVDLVVECLICNKIYSFNITPTQYRDYMMKKGYIQHIFPELTPAERELLLSGICLECWESMFGEFD